MRISDWSSDVCSSDLMKAVEDGFAALKRDGTQANIVDRMQTRKRLYELIRYEDYNRFDQGLFNLDRKSVVSGKSVSVRVDLGGRRILKKKNTNKLITNYKEKIISQHTKQH